MRSTSLVAAIVLAATVCRNTPGAAHAGGGRSMSEIADDYRRAHRDVVRRFPHGPRDRDTDASPVLDPVWALIGEWAAAYLAAHPDASARQLTAKLVELNVDDPEPTPTYEAYDIDSFFDELARYHVVPAVRPLPSTGATTFAIALTYGYWGRLEIVSRDGIATSAAIDRGGTFHPLPPSGDGHQRFYVDARSDDWPTSMCRGGQLGIWEWNGKHAVRLLQTSYGDMGPGPGWGIRLRRDTLTVHTRGELKTFGECCGCAQLKAVRTIRLGPHRVEDLGLEYDTPEFQLADELLYRTLRGEDVSDIAAPDAARALAAFLQTECRVEDSYNLGLMMGGTRTVDGSTTTFRLVIDPDAFTFTIVRRGGRPFVTAVETPSVALRKLQAAIDAWLKRNGADRLDAGMRRRAADAVLAERPELATTDADVEQAIGRPWDAACEGQPWPWR